MPPVIAQRDVQFGQSTAARFPAEAPPAEQLSFLLRYAIAAPSVRNTQPWRFRLSGDAVTLLADRSRQLTTVDSDGRELLMSCGAALFHLRLALRGHGLRDEVQLAPDPDDADALATVRAGSAADPSLADTLLFPAITTRQTTRGPLAEQRPAPMVIAAMRTAARVEGAWLHTIDADRARRDVAALIAEGDQIERQDTAIQQQLAQWMASPIRTFATARGIATEPPELATGSPLLAVLETEGDGPEQWLTAGQALARVLLRAAADGVQASFLNQPLHHPGLRSRLRGIIGGSDTPQVILRLGYGPPGEPTPRRPLADVVQAG